MHNNLIDIENQVAVIDGINANILLLKTKEKLPISIFQTGNYLNLETKNVFSSTARLELYNSNGQMVMNTPMNESTDFDISLLKSGIYFYNIYDGKDLYKGKLFLKLE
jgi:fumarate hydratase class II